MATYAKLSIWAINAYMDNAEARATDDASHISSVDDFNWRSVSGTTYQFDYNGETFNATYSGNSWNIVDSYRIENWDDLMIISEWLAEKHSISSINGGYRSAESFAYEWQQHNIAYQALAPWGWLSFAIPQIGVGIDRAADVDIDFGPDEGKTAIQLLISRLRNR